MTTVNGRPLKTVIHKLRPVREIEPGYWKLRWQLIKHRGIGDGDGTWNLYWSKAYRWHSIGVTATWALPQDGSQYGRRNNAFSLALGLWFGTVEFWLKWGFRASTMDHGDGVDGIDLAAWNLQPSTKKKMGRVIKTLAMLAVLISSAGCETIQWHRLIG